MYDVDQHDLEPDAFEATNPKGERVKVVPAAPAVILADPKYPHNLGQVVRAASCFDVHQVWWSGQRVLKALEGLGRIPREERMRGYADVSILHADRPLEAFKGVVPVCVELVPGAEDLTAFEHPENAVYVFGPEDGSVDQGTRRNCHRFVRIPTRHCTNLSAAVYLVLYDRYLKHVQRGQG
jgi:tRNA(Leu) C34 or U34 (ribose-2'-O)-methylase TrmL